MENNGSQNGAAITLYRNELLTPNVIIFPIDKLGISSQRLQILQSRLTDYAKNIELLDKKTRNQLQNMFTRKNKGYEPQKGATLARFVSQNRIAIKQLIDNLKQVSVLIAPERGGAFLQDLIKEQITEKIRLIKVPKPKKKLYNHNKLEHYPLVKDAVIHAIEEGHKNVGLVDTMVGGGSAQQLVKIAQELVKSYHDIEFTILIHQNTLHEDNCSQHEISYPLKYSGNSIFISPSNTFPIKTITSSEHNNKESYGKIIIANGNNGKFNRIVGEDVDFQRIFCYNIYG